MDTLPNLKPTAFSSSSFPSRNLKLIALVIGFILLIVVGVYLYSQYLKPDQQLTNIPQPTQNQAEVPPPPPYYFPELQAGPFTCPVDPTLCKNASSYQGTTFSTNLPANSPIYASFYGFAQGLKSFHPNDDGTQEEFITVMLINSSSGLQASYQFKGQPFNKKEVQEGEIMATSSGEPMVFLDNKSLVFDFIKMASDGGKLVELSSQDFK